MRTKYEAHQRQNALVLRPGAFFSTITDFSRLISLFLTILVLFCIILFMFKSLFERKPPERPVPLYDKDDVVFAGTEDYEQENDELSAEVFDNTWTPREVKRSQMLLRAIDEAILPEYKKGISQFEKEEHSKQVKDLRQGYIHDYLLRHSIVRNADGEYELSDKEEPERKYFEVSDEQKNLIREQIKNTFDALRKGDRPSDDVSPKQLVAILKKLVNSRRFDVLYADFKNKWAAYEKKVWGNLGPSQGRFD